MFIGFIISLTGLIASTYLLYPPFPPAMIIFCLFSIAFISKFNVYNIKCELCGKSSNELKYHQGECTDPTTNIKEDLTICDICYKELEIDAKDTEDLNNSLPWVIQNGDN